MRDSERSLSVWKASVPPLERAALDADATCDVCVVGAGIAGLSVAYHLAREGRSVVVLDDNAVGGAETGQTTAHLASALDDRYYQLARVFGADGARLAYESHDAAIGRIDAIARDEGIDCDLLRLDGYLFAGEGRPARELDRELEAARAAGFTDAEKVAHAPLPGLDTGPCLRFPRQGQIHPLAYLHGLVDAIERRGGRIHTGTHAVRFTAERRRGGVRVETSAGRAVSAAALVVATNVPVNDRVTIHSKQEPYRTFVVALRLPPGAVPRALFWDTEDPYHYVRTQPGRDGDDLLIVGGEDHKTGTRDDAAERYGRLEGWTRARFPTAGEVVHRWSGQVIEPFDLLAYIGRNPGDSPDVYVATGDSGHGMTHGTIAGMLICDLIQGRPNPWASLYDPGRKTARAAVEYVRVNAGVAAKYLDWVRPGEVSSVEEIRPGSGALLRRGLGKVAVSRGDDGRLTACRAVCPHLGGVVHWNSEERSWDCPVHGSRFSAAGEVLNGPACAGLAPAPPEPERAGDAVTSTRPI